MVDQPLPQRVEGQQGKGGVVFSLGSLGIEMMVMEKMVSSSFGGIRGPGMRTPSLSTAGGLP